MAMGTYPTIPLERYPTHDLAWLSGRWQGQHGADLIEEHWSEPVGETLMAMFRWLRSGAVLFYELIVIEADGQGLVMRIKHFNPGLLGWEEKNEAVCFDLVQAEGQEAVFLQRRTEEPVWLIYEREREDQLLAYFVRPEQHVDPAGVFRYELA